MSWYDTMMMMKLMTDDQGQRCLIKVSRESRTCSALPDHSIPLLLPTRYTVKFEVYRMSLRHQVTAVQTPETSGLVVYVRPLH